MNKDPRVYLAHIMECIQRVERFTAEGRSRFFQDVMVQDAVLRNFEIIGEAAKRLDDAYRAAHPQIPWRALAGLRDMLIHQYDSVDVERVWAMVEGGCPVSERRSRRCCRPWISWSGNSRAKMKPRRTNEYPAPCASL